MSTSLTVCITFVWEDCNCYAVLPPGRIPLARLSMVLLLVSEYHCVENRAQGMGRSGGHIATRNDDLETSIKAVSTST